MPMLQYLQGLEAGGKTDLSSSIERYAQARKRPGILVIASDLLSSNADDLQQVLRHLRSRGWQTTILHILDPWEIAPVRENAGTVQTLQFQDSEDGSQLDLTLDDQTI
jgi:hypothetical protein